MRGSKSITTELFNEKAFDLEYRCADQYLISVAGPNKSIKIWDLQLKEQVTEITGAHEREISTIAIANDRNYFITGSEDGTLRVWNLQKRACLFSFDIAHKKQVTSIVPLQTTKLFASSGIDGTIRIWDMKAQKCVHKGGVTAMACTTHTNILISAGGFGDCTIKLWDLTTLKMIHAFENSHNGWVKTIVVSSDDKYFITGCYDTSIKIWSINKKILMYSFDDAHSHWISALVLSFDNRTLISACWDTCIKIWDLPKRRCVHTIELAHIHWITSLAITSDGRHFLSGSRDCNIKIWNIESRECVHTFSAAHLGYITDLRLIHTHIPKDSERMESLETNIVTERSMSPEEIHDSVEKLMEDFEKPEDLENPEYWMKRCKELEDEMKLYIEASQKWKTNYYEILEKFQTSKQKFLESTKQHEEIESANAYTPVESTKNLNFSIKRVHPKATIFHIAAYVLEPIQYRKCQNDKERKRLVVSVKKLISYYAMKHQASYNYDTVKEYTAFIEGEQAIGSDAEMKVLADHYGVQFCVFNIEGFSLTPSIIPHKDSHEKRVYLILDKRNPYEQYYDLIIAGDDGGEFGIFRYDDKNAYSQSLLLAEQIRQNIDAKSRAKQQKLL